MAAASSLPGAPPSPYHTLARSHARSAVCRSPDTWAVTPRHRPPLLSAAFASRDTTSAGAGDRFAREPARDLNRNVAQPIAEDAASWFVFGGAPGSRSERSRLLNIMGSAEAQRALAFAIVSVIDVGLFVLVFLVLRSRRIGFRLAAAVIAMTALAYLVSLAVFLRLSLRS